MVSRPTCIVKFTTMDQVQKFIDQIRKMPYDVNACHGNYVVDAKSLLGILSLSLGREICLEVMCDEGSYTLADELLQALCEDFR